MTTEAVNSQNIEKNSSPQPNTYVKDYLINVLGQVRILNKLYPGIMHLLIFWGMTFLILGHIVLLMQMALFLPFELNFPRENTYLIFETISDYSGLALLSGLTLAATRRLVIKPKYLVSRWDDYYAILILALLPLLGYINEAIRLIASAPAWASYSPIGNLVAGWFRNLGMTPQIAANIHLPLVIVHVIVGLTFIASIPYTKLRHLIVTPINILLRPHRKTGELEAIDDIENAEILGVGSIEEFSTAHLMSFDACLRCGRCEDVCPANIAGMDYSPKILIQTLRDTMQSSLVTPLAPNGTSQRPDIFGDYSWACTTCGACIIKCPAFVNPVDQVIDLRRYQVLTSGKMPKTVGETLRNMERQGNPWGLPPQERGKWSEGLDLPIIQPGTKTDVLLFFGCAMAFDERNKKIARSITKLLNSMDVNYATLGVDEACCGETGRRIGNEYLFQVMAEQNIELFQELDFERIVTPCPHCFNTLKNEYPKFGGEYKVMHITELLEEKGIGQTEILKNGQKATYHDPCYLGRYNEIFDAPRALLKATDLEMHEMHHNQINSFCCGGGGGQMWLETDAETRVNHYRLQEAVDVDADVILTACPYCLTMMEDAVGAKGLSQKIKVLDITEALMEQKEK